MKNSGFLTNSATQLKKSASNSIIAGKSAGKRVLCSHSALSTYNDLVKLANNGNYWARLIVSGISGLSVGRLNKDNIYLDQSAGIAYGEGSFYMVLPGVTATFIALSNGTYILQTLKADTNYLNHQEQSTKPGLWRVTGSGEDLSVKLQRDGSILNEKYRPVVISDMAKIDGAQSVAFSVSKDLSRSNPLLKNMVQNNGFDMHYTPGKSGGIVGLKKASQALSSDKDRDIISSSILLANTMYQARKIEGVLWYSDWGGSAVLTRALQILSREKSLKKLKNHSIFMNRPTSSPKQAIELAGNLGITPLGKGKKTGFLPKEIAGHILHTEIGVNKETGTGLMKTAGFGVGAAGASFSIASAALTIPGAFGIAGALFFVGAAVAAGTEKFKGKDYK